MKVLGAKIMWLLKYLDLSVLEGNIALSQITWTVVPAMLCFFLHTNHAQNNAQSVLKVFNHDLTITNQTIGVSL